MSSTWKLTFVLFINRLALGLYFCMGGYAKIKGGLAAWVDSDAYKKESSWLPDFIATAYGYALPFAQIAVGAMLVIGLFSRLASLFIALILASVMIATSFSGNNAELYDRNVILMTLSIMFIVTGPGSVSIDRFLGNRKAKTPVTAPAAPVKK